MPDHVGNGVVLEVSDKDGARIHLSAEDAKALAEWQKLKPNEKENLIKLARAASPLLNLVKVAEWLSGTSYLILRAGALGAAVLAVLSVIRNFTGT